MENWFLGSHMLSNIGSTVLLIISVLILRSFVIRAIQKWPIQNLEVRRRWIVQIKNSSFLLLLLGLVFVWGTELKTFAVSIIAIAAAFVLATKELILCILGGLMKAGGQSFSVGDRIEIAGVRGDVVDHNLVTTTLFEVGPGKEFHHFTGRVVTLPNSFFLSQPLINETETGEFVLHIFRVAYPRASGDWIEARTRLLETAREVCQPYYASAKRQFMKLAKSEGLETPNVEPRVSISYTEPDRVDLLVRIAVPNTGKSRIEQAILSRFAGLPDQVDLPDWRESTSERNKSKQSDQAKET
ncbi:MAG: mechanosensitive ion channel domain-containing protein [Oligoflexus sp.]